jgi:stage V sporulation protein B
MGICNIVDLGMIMRRLSAMGISEESAVALYGNFTTLVVPMLNLVTALSSPIGTSALPRLAEDFAGGDAEGFKNFFGRTISVTAFFIVPIAFGFARFPIETLSLIFKDDSARAAASLLTLIAPSVVFMPMLAMVHTALEASKHQRMPIISMLVLAAVKVMASYMLIGKLGIAGAPIGTTVSYALAFATSLLLLRFSTGISPFVFLHLVRPTLSSVLAVEIGRAFYDAFSKGNNEVLLFFICVIVCVALYFIFMILLSMISVKKILNFVRINKKKDA